MEWLLQAYVLGVWSLFGKTVSEGYGTFLMWVLAGRWSLQREWL